MSNTNQHKNTSEEVDLAQLFKIIGNGFSSFFNFIWRVFKGLFHLLMLFLLFIRKHFIKFAVALVVGVIAGYFLDERREVIYAADLVIKPNFGSAQQLYNNISYYNNIVLQGDTLLLASTFNISPSEAAALRSFYISPVENENTTLETYSRFLEQITDSIVMEQYPYENFKKNVSAYDYYTHNIQVTAVKSGIFRKLQSVIINSIEKNSYFDIKKKATLENLNRSDSILKNAMTDIDSLKNVYTQVLLSEAKREKTPQSGTSVVLSDKAVKTNEMELFNTKMRYRNELNNNELQRVESTDVIGIISSFQPLGYKIDILYKRYMFIFGVAAVALVFLYLILMELNRFLNAYHRKDEE